MRSVLLTCGGIRKHSILLLHPGCLFHHVRSLQLTALCGFWWQLCVQQLRKSGGWKWKQNTPLSDLPKSLQPPQLLSCFFNERDVKTLVEQEERQRDGGGVELKWESVFSHWSSSTLMSHISSLRLHWVFRLNIGNKSSQKYRKYSICGQTKILVSFFLIYINIHSLPLSGWFFISSSGPLPEAW